MEFISVSDVAKRRAKRSGRSSVVSGITITQVYYYERETPSRVMTIRISEDIVTRARLKRGDKIDIGFSPDGKTWRLKVMPQDSLGGYSMTTSTKISKSGILRLTWYKGIPLFGDNPKVAKSRVHSDSKIMKVSPAEVIFSISEPLIEEMVPDEVIPVVV
ncbi:hypothetical protein TI10_12815 [Photorhabdus luminescens subsp. luminescens]|uniref:Uncharacterized protein n=1 Tax=Photorhabdus luminescens TaxID=29488 RepID=A0A1G5QWM5_PHOLU|nr:hypothetical protein [Photorhabdus luminescens]KMW72993.1 hypothetical protein TI10_12815 [Photorhabdus luminescens subsp. luminescens]SCZ66086.1 hypothetical protein SAMN02982990_02501 [Photorhabdus luminescens]